MAVSGAGAYGGQGTQFSRLASELERSAFAFSSMVSAATVFSNSINAFKALEAQLVNANAVANATREEFRAMEKAARDFALATKVSAADAASSLYFLASAGFDAKESMAAMSGTLLLAQATLIPAAEAADITSSAIRAFGLAASDSARVANVLVASTANSQATIQKLAYAFRQVGPVAKIANLSIEKTTAALSVLFDVGLRGEQAGTALRNTIVRLANPVGEAKVIIDSLGLSVTNVDGSMRDLQDILTDLAKFKLPESALARIFGTEALAGASALLEATSTKWTDLQNKITGTNDAFRISQQQLNSLQGSFDLATNAANELAIAVGEKLSPFLRAVADSFSSAVAAMRKGEATFVGYATQVLLVTATVGGLGIALNGLFGTLVMSANGFMKMASATAVIGCGIKKLAGYASTAVVAYTRFLELALFKNGFWTSSWGKWVSQAKLGFSGLSSVIQGVGAAASKAFRPLGYDIVSAVAGRNKAFQLGMTNKTMAGVTGGAALTAIGATGATLGATAAVGAVVYATSSALDAWKRYREGLKTTLSESSIDVQGYADAVKKQMEKLDLLYAGMDYSSRANRFGALSSIAKQSQEGIDAIDSQIKAMEKRVEAYRYAQSALAGGGTTKYTGGGMPQVSTSRDALSALAGVTSTAERFIGVTEVVGAASTAKQIGDSIKESSKSTENVISSVEQALAENGIVVSRLFDVIRESSDLSTDFITRINSVISENEGKDSAVIGSKVAAALINLIGPAGESTVESVRTKISEATTERELLKIELERARKERTETAKVLFTGVISSQLSGSSLEPFRAQLEDAVKNQESFDTLVKSVGDVLSPASVMKAFTDYILDSSGEALGEEQKAVLEKDSGRLLIQLDARMRVIERERKKLGATAKRFAAERAGDAQALSDALETVGVEDVIASFVDRIDRMAPGLQDAVLGLDKNNQLIGGILSGDSLKASIEAAALQSGVITKESVVAIFNKQAEDLDAAVKELPKGDRRVIEQYVELFRKNILGQEQIDAVVNGLSQAREDAQKAASALARENAQGVFTAIQEETEATLARLSQKSPTDFGAALSVQNSLLVAQYEKSLSDLNEEIRIINGTSFDDSEKERRVGLVNRRIQALRISHETALEENRRNNKRAVEEFAEQQRAFAREIEALILQGDENFLTAGGRSLGSGDTYVIGAREIALQYAASIDTIDAAIREQRDRLGDAFTPDMESGLRTFFANLYENNRTYALATLEQEKKDIRRDREAAFDEYIESSIENAQRAREEIRKYLPESPASIIASLKTYDKAANDIAVKKQLAEVDREMDRMLLQVANEPDSAAMSDRIRKAAAEEKAAIRASAVAYDTYTSSLRYAEEAARRQVGVTIEQIETMASLHNISDGVTLAFLDLENEIPSAMELARDGMKQALTEMGSSLADFVLDAEFTFDSLRDAVSTTLRSIAKDILQAQITRGIANIASAAFGIDLTSLVSGKAANGGIMINKSLQTFATGGVVAGPTVFPTRTGIGLMGEAGPEAIMPLTRLANGKLGVNAEGSGGAIVINNTVNVQGGASGNAQMDEEFAKKIASATSASVRAIVRDELVKQTRPGNLFNPGY